MNRKVLPLLASFCLVYAGAAYAQSYPNRAVKMIVPAPAGGGIDLVARRVGQKLSEMWGQPVVVENRAGGGTNIGGALAAHSKADGYTLLVSAGGLFAVNPFLYKDQGFDPFRDFVAVTQIASAPYVLATYSGFPPQSVKQFINWGRENPGKISWASSPAGTFDHMAGELFRLSTGIQMVNVPYKGAAPAIADVMGGHVPSIFVSIPTSISYIKTGKLRVLGVTSAKRFSGLPDIPTVAESGYPDYDVSTWYGIWAPTGTPSEIVRKIQADVSRAVKQQDIKNWMADSGFEVVADTPEQFAVFIKRETAKYEAVVGKLGLPKE